MDSVLLTVIDDWLPVAMVTILFGTAIVAGINRRFFKQRRGITVPGTSVLIAYYLSDTQVLIGSGQQRIGELTYTAIAAQNTLINSVIYCVQLPFKSQVHILGIPKNDTVVQLEPNMGRSLMEKVVLEGNYQDYFTLYAEKGQQTEARYVLDPAAMAFTVDFCRSHNWEIIGSELYFLQAGANAPDDPTTMFDDILSFVKQIEPAVTAHAKQPSIL